MATPIWPLFDLRVRTQRLELRYPDDETCELLALAADGDLFAGSGNQFILDWTAAPSPERERSSMQFFWRCRADFTPEHWNLPMAVIVEGEVAGSQGIMADHFCATRSVSSGSWLAPRFQGRGLGREMRLAILHLAFDGLGATEAHSEAFETNERSARVSRSLGYADNGEAFKMRGSQATRSVQFRMTDDAFARVRRDDVTIEHLEDCLALFGLGASA